MTREEAIKGLKNVSTMFTGYKPNEEMFAMAIRSLEAWDTIREIFKAKSTSEDWEYIHDLQIWEDALEIIEKNLTEVEK